MQTDFDKLINYLDVDKNYFWTVDSTGNVIISPQNSEEGTESISVDEQEFFEFLSSIDRRMLRNKGKDILDWLKIML